MNLLDKTLENICNKIQISKEDVEFKKFEHLVTMTNQAYLKIALKEFEYVKNHTDKEIVSNFDFLMKIYNKHLREHQVMFLLLNIFETAIRSKAVVELSKKYSSIDEDDWLHNEDLTPNKIKKPLEEAIKKINQDREDKTKLDSFEIFVRSFLDNVYRFLYLYVLLYFIVFCFDLILCVWFCVGLVNYRTTHGDS